MKVAWSETEKFRFNLPYRRSALTPTDIIQITDKAGAVHRIRIMERQDDSGLQDMEAAKDRQSAYTSNVTGKVTPPPVSTSPGLIGPTSLVVMNLPVWSKDADDEVGVYIAGSGVLSGWHGAQVQASGDEGSTYQAIAEIVRPSTIGYTQTALAAWVSSEYPSVQTLTVYLPDAPESITYEALLRYGNRLAVELASGEWEILQFQTVANNGNDSYTLSGLVRGRYNTTPGAVSIGATAVVLDESVQFARVEQSTIGDEFLVRAVSYGTSEDAYTGVPYGFDHAQSQTEWPVHNVTA